MINKMREMAPMIMLVILVAFVGGTIFLDWGMNAASKSTKVTEAGKVNGKTIPLSYFDKQVNDERQRLQSGGREVPPYQYQMIPGQLWEKEVSGILVKEAFQKMKLSATADEVFEHIKRNPLPGIDTVSIFLTNGVFDTTKYVQFLNNPQNYTNYPFLREIEQYTRDVIVPAQKLEALINSSAIPSKAEVEYEYNNENQKVVFEYAKVDRSSFTVDVNEITESMIKNYYTAHKDSFIEPEMTDLYFVKFPKVANAADEQFYYDEMIDLKKKIQTSGDSLSATFANEARIESDDPGSAENGGDLGWFGKGAMVPQFDSVVFSCDPGTISDPIKTQFGYHLILVEGKELKDGQEKVKARHILRKITPTVESLDRLAEMADSLRTLIVDKGINEVTKFPGSQMFDSTGYFKRGDMIPKIGYVSGAGQFAFRRDDAKVSERLENDEGIFLFAIKSVHKKGLLPLESVKDEVVTSLKDSLQIEKAREFAQSFESKMVDGSPLSLKDKDPKLTVAITDSIAVKDYIPGIGYQSKVAVIAAVQPAGKTSKVIEFQKNFYIVKTMWKGSVPPIDWSSANTKQLVERTIQMNQQRVYSDWSDELRRDAKIVKNIDQYYFD